MDILEICLYAFLALEIIALAGMLFVAIPKVMYNPACDNVPKHSELGCKCDCQKIGWEFWDYKPGVVFRQPECWCAIEIYGTETKRIW